MKILTGDAFDVLQTLPDESVHCCVTSPPYYGLRDYGINGQIGLEASPETYVEKLVQVFHEVRRVLRNDGTLWLNLGDSYASNYANGGQRDFSSSMLKKDGRPEEGRLKTLLVNAKELKREKPNQRIEHGVKPKDLLGIPWRVAFALQADGWYIRSDIIWHKPNPMPESVTDRPTKSHEYIFLLSKSKRYFYDAAAIREPNHHGDSGWAKQRFSGINTKIYRRKPIYGEENGGHSGIDFDDTIMNGRNKRTVWSIATTPYKEAHFATFPPELPRLCILAGCPEGGVVLDPFSGAGTTGLVALRLGRDYIGIELNPEYVKMSHQRIINDAPLFNGQECKL